MESGATRKTGVPLLVPAEHERESGISNPVGPQSPDRAEATLRDYLNTRTKKLTKNRKLILDVFLLAGSHRTIEELYYQTKVLNPRVGLATVYRSVKILCDCGLVSGFKHTDGVFRYELGREYHEHLICIKCGRLFEVSDPQIKAMQNALAKRNGFKILHSRLELYGICRECL